MLPDAAPPDTSPSIDDWAGPSLRARAVAVLLAIAIAVVIVLIVNRVWRGAAPSVRSIPAAAATKPASVEVQLVGPPVAATPAPRR